MARNLHDQVIIDAMIKLVKVGAKVESRNAVLATPTQGKVAGINLKDLWQETWASEKGLKASIDQVRPSRPLYRLVYQCRRNVLKETG